MTLKKKLTSILLLVSSQALFAGTCEDLNCDCASIPNVPLKESCEAHERFLKSSCGGKQSNVRGYCALHGPNAFPVAITLRVKNVAPSENVKTSDRQVAQLYWSIREDVSYTKNGFEVGDYVSAAAVLKISKQNLATLFKTQLSVVAYWRVNSNPKKLKKAWKNYSKDTQDLAEFWQEFLDEVKAFSTENAEDQNLRMYTQALAELVGSIYEQAGYGFARAERFESAAMAWKAASSASADITAMLVRRQGTYAEIEKYTDQTTSRLHRASLYWLQRSREQNPVLKAKEAVDFASDKLLQEILLGVDDNEGA